jgi:hypothetical protein
MRSQFRPTETLIRSSEIPSERSHDLTAMMVVSLGANVSATYEE